MPHGESWFSFFGLDGLSGWLSHTFGPSIIAHNPHLSAQHIVAYAVVVGLLILIGLMVRSRASDLEKSVVPEGKLSLLSFIELITSSVYGMMKDLMGEKEAKFFLPLIGTCALVIFFSNVLGLIPGFLPPTDNLNTTAAMAIVIFVVTHIWGIKEQGFIPYFAHFTGPPVPWWIAWFIKPLMFMIETVSHLVRPVTLAIRLMANMTADHLVLGIFFGLFAGMGAWWLPIPVAMYVMGVIVVTVQTLVFCLLSSIYIALAIEHSEDH